MYWLYALDVVCVFIVVCVGAHLLTTAVGGVSLAQGALLGVSAYCVAIGTTHWEFSFWAAWAAGILASCAISFVLGRVSFRVGGDSFVVVTLGFQVLAWSVANNWSSVTGGPMGLPGISRPALLFWPLDTLGRYSAVCWFVTIGVVFACRYLVSGAYGQILVAVREQPDWVASLGIDVARIKTEAAVVAGACAGIAGGLLAGLVQFVDPSVMAFGDSLLIVSIVALAYGRGVERVVIGAVLLVGGPELLRFVGMSAPLVGHVRQLVFGLALIIFSLRAAHAFPPAGTRT